jgi:RNA polymerase sigma-B factor
MSLTTNVTTPPAGLTPEQTRLVVEYEPRVRKIARKMQWKYADLADGVDLDEMVSDGYVGLLRAARRFDPALGDFGGYAYRCVCQSIREHLGRRAARRAREVPVTDLGLTDENGDPVGMELLALDRAASAEDTVALEELLGTLSRDERYCIEKLYLERATQAEVAEVLGVSQRMVGKIAEKALAQMRSLGGGEE